MKEERFEKVVILENVPWIWIFYFTMFFLGFSLFILTSIFLNYKIDGFTWCVVCTALFLSFIRLLEGRKVYWRKIK